MFRFAFLVILSACTLLQVENEPLEGRYSELKKEVKVDEPGK